MNTYDKYYKVGGSLEHDDPSYVTRLADNKLYECLKNGEFCYVLNSRQMGKSSLGARIKQKLEQEKTIICGYVDLSGIGKEDVTLKLWCSGFIQSLVRSCHLTTDWRTWFREQISFSSPMTVLKVFIEEELLDKITEKKIVIFVDEIDSVLNQKFPLDDFFKLIRYWHEQRSTDQKLKYKRLSFALLGVGTPYDLMNDRNQIPFNIGTPIELDGFNEKESQPLEEGLKGRVDNPKLMLKKILSWTGGQPFLTQKLCKLVATSATDSFKGEVKNEEAWLEQLVQSQIIENWESQDEPQHLRTIRDRILGGGDKTISLLKLYQEILQQGEIVANENPEQMELRLSGLVVKQEGKLKVYNHLYKSIFNQAWLNKALTEYGNDEPTAEAKLQIELNTLSNDKNRIKKVREKYLEILTEDVKNRLETSVHQARFIDIGSERSPDSTHLPWVYQTDDIKTFTSFEEAFTSFKKRVLVLGAPGSGKTTVLLHLAKILIKEAQENLKAPIPLLFNLSKFKDSTQSSSRYSLSFFKQRIQQEKSQNSSDQNAAVEEWLIDLTAKTYPGVTRDIASYWVKTEQVALLLDGLDEFDDQQLKNLAIKLNSYLFKYPELTVVICSRIVEYQSLKDQENTRLQLNGAVTLQPLNQKQINIYLEEAQATSLRDALANDAVLYEMAQTPLTLSIMILAYGGFAPTDFPTNLSLVERRQHLFNTYIEQMMQRQACRKKNRYFDPKSVNNVPKLEYSYSRDQVNHYLGWLAVRLSERMKTVFPLDQLYSFLNQPLEGKQSKPGWKVTTIVDKIAIVLYTLLIELFLIPKTSTTFNQLIFVTNVFIILLTVYWRCIYLLETDNLVNDNLGHDQPFLFKILSVISDIIVFILLAIFISLAAGSILISITTFLPLGFSSLEWGVAIAVAVTAFSYISSNFNEYKPFPFVYLVTTIGSALLPLTPVCFNRSLVFSEIGFILSIAIAQWIFLSLKLYQENSEEQEVFELIQAFLWVLAGIIGIIILEWLGIFLIGVTVDWYEATVLIGLTLGFLNMTLDDYSIRYIFCTIAGTLIGSFFDGARGSVLGTVGVLLLMGLGNLYSESFDKLLDEKRTSIQVLINRAFEVFIDQPVEKYVLNPILSLVLTLLGLIPFDCKKFLAYTIDTLLLKQVSTDYEFIHRSLRDHFAIRELTPKLRNNVDLETQIQTIQQMSFQGDSAFETLAELAKENPDPNIRQAAINGLGRIAISGVIPIFQAALKEDPDITVRQAVVNSISKLLKSDAKTLLEYALEDRSSEVRLAAVNKISKEYSYIYNNNKVEEEGVRLLVTFFIREEDIEILGRIIQICQKESIFRTKFANFLREQMTPQIMEKLLNKLLTYSQPEIRSNTATFLATLGDSSTVHPLIACLKDPEIKVKISVMHTLATLNDPIAIPPLLDVLQDKHESVRAASATALGKIADVSVIFPLTRALQDKHESVRAASATALGKIADVSVISPLTRALRDKHESVRAASATALGEIADVSVISPLTRALRDRSHRVRHNALIALKQIRRDELVVPHLANLLQDLKSKSYGLKYYDDYTSYEVVKILKQIGTTEALAAVNSYETHEPLRGIGGEKY